MKNNSRIEDNASFQKLLREMQTLEQFRKAYPILKPFLKAIGISGEQIESALAQVEPLPEQAREMATLPDRFNALFGARGWIMYEMMNYEVARNAVIKGEAGDVDGAEQDLVEYYSENTIHFNIIWLSNVKAFRPRAPLARKALADYIEGRYHACVPVVLALLDGTVNDLGPKGFFAEGVSLEAWDSIAAHSTGLAELAKLLGKRRQKTTTDELRIPYRHGILHGMDLGYDNKLVAAKAWAALFAMRDWAIKVEKGQIEEPPEEPKKGWGDIIKQIRENNDNKALLDAWVPRSIHLGLDVPVSGGPEAFEDGSPEQRLAEFLQNWASRNYGRMAQCLSYAERKHLSKVAGQIRSHYDAKHLEKFEILDLRDQAPALTIVKVKLMYEENGIEVNEIVDFRLLKEDVTGEPVARSKTGRVWAVLTAFV